MRLVLQLLFGPGGQGSAVPLRAVVRRRAMAIDCLAIDTRTVTQKKGNSCVRWLVVFVVDVVTVVFLVLLVVVLVALVGVVGVVGGGWSVVGRWLVGDGCGCGGGCLMRSLKKVSAYVSKDLPLIVQPLLREKSYMHVSVPSVVRSPDPFPFKLPKERFQMPPPLGS